MWSLLSDKWYRRFSDLMEWQWQWTWLLSSIPPLLPTVYISHAACTASHESCQALWLLCIWVNLLLLILSYKHMKVASGLICSTREPGTVTMIMHSIDSDVPWMREQAVTYPPSYRNDCEMLGDRWVGTRVSSCLVILEVVHVTFMTLILINTWVTPLRLAVVNWRTPIDSVWSYQMSMRKISPTRNKLWSVIWPANILMCLLTFV